MKKITVILLLAISLFGNAKAQSIQKYFGYYAGDVNNPPSTAISEFKSHVNLYHMINWSGDTSTSGRSLTTQILLSELARARAAHLHAIIPAYPYVFQYNSASGCFSTDTGASQAWNTFIQTLVSAGYIDTESPDRSVVSAIYVVDEPNGAACLSDISGTANPALQNAVAAIRSNANTAWLPLASILEGGSAGFSSIANGMQLFDWVGFDDYSASQSTWASEFANLKSYVPTKKYILVPGAQSADVPSECVGNNSPTPFIQEMESDPKAVWLAPFVWFSSGSCLGVRDIPSLRATYTNIGITIKAEGCSSSFAARNYCKPQSMAAVINFLFNQ